MNVEPSKALLYKTQHFLGIEWDIIGKASLALCQGFTIRDGGIP